MATLMYVITAVILITYSRVSVQIRKNVEFGPSPIIAMSYSRHFKRGIALKVNGNQIYCTITAIKYI